MNPRRIIIIGTMAMAITIGGGTWNKTSASPLANSYPSRIKVPLLATHYTNIAKEDKLLETLGAASDEEIYQALYNGKSLADIAADHQQNVQNVINLQISEMTVQLSLRLARSSLTYDQYQAQKSELTEIITNSVYSSKNRN